MAVASVARPGLAAAQPDVATLEPGAAVTRELGPGEIHVFQFALDVGQLLDAAVEPHGVDVAVTVVAPDGAVILAADRSDDPMALERVLWIGRAAGTYSLSIRAKLDRPGGRYEEADVLDETAEVELAVNRRKEALTSAQQALVIYRELRDPTAQAAALRKIGLASRWVGDTERELDSFEEALRLSRETSNGWAESACLNHETYNLRLPVDLVVLSACQTALGREIRGEGLVGLTRGFMYAGARRVVASLWQVDDESTAELMKRFYRAMLKEGRRPADALRTAQLELSRHPRWAAPF